MTITSLIYLTIMISAGIICSFILIDVLPGRNQNSETIPFVILMTGIIVWIIAALAGLLDQNLSHKLLWAKVEYFGVVSVPLALLIFILFHSGFDRRLISKWSSILLIVPVITIILVWTNGSHGWIWREYIPYKDIGFTLSRKVYGAGFWIYWVYSYILLLAATILTFRLMRKSPGMLLWQQSVVLIFGILAPWIGNLLYVLHISPMGPLDLTPIAFSVTGIMLAIGMFRWRLIDIKPIAHVAVIKGLKDGVVFLDFAGRIVDLNPSARNILNLDPNQVIGEEIKRFIPDWKKDEENLDLASGRSIILKINRDQKERIYEINDSPFYEKVGKFGGRVIVLHDATARIQLEEKIKALEQKETQALIQHYENKYEILYKNMTIGVIYQNSEGRIIEMNPAAEYILGVGISRINDLLWTNEDLKTIRQDGSLLRPEERFGLVSLKTGRSFRNQIMGVRLSEEEEWRWVNVNSVPQFQNNEPKPYQVFVTLEDITALKRADETISKNYQKLNETFKGAINLLAIASEQRDPYTSGHQIRVSKLATAIAVEMGLDENIVEGITIAGVIHDIGKMSIPSELLSKPTKLTELEYSLIQTHSESGYSILKNIDFPWPIAEIVYQHHERLDGSGYPRKLKGDKMLLEAKILAVADVVEAMSSYRPYRPSLGIEAALAEISENKGVTYDPNVVESCQRLFEENKFSFDKINH